MLAKGNVGKKKTQPLVAVAIDKDKGSQYALKYASDNLLAKGQTVVLIHVVKSSSLSSRSNLVTETLSICANPDPHTRELFHPFRIFCTRKDIHCKDVVLEETDVARALTEYVTYAAIEVLVVGASAKGGFLRFKTTDIPATVSKTAPDFCSVYVISKGKIASMRSSSRPAPAVSSMRSQILSMSHSSEDQPQTQNNHPLAYAPTPAPKGADKPPMELKRAPYEDNDFFRSPFTRKGPDGKQYKEPPLPDTDISYVSSARPSIDADRPFPVAGDYNQPPGGRLSVSSDFDSFNTGFDGPVHGRKSLDIFAPNDLINNSNENLSSSSQSVEDVEAEMRRLKMELKQTMEMYSTACKEALSAKEMARELQRWKLEEERRLEEARQAEEAAMLVVHREKAKSRAAMEAAEAAKRIAELESQKRLNAEMKAMKESDERKQVLEKMTCSDIRYRKYTIEEIEAATNFFSESQKIGEGGYGPVYKGFLDHTPVAIKVLRPDAAQGRSQFQQEVEVLSCIRHPNMVLLLGACPEYGCLVYEFMANGSLEDRLFQLGNTPPLSWQIRFRIAAEIGTGLLFLHQTKPEPLVHRDLKPANILLDRNYVSKISDVGLARLVPPSVAETVTQYRMTSTAGTFCYIDPEYQQTGMLGVKSDVYSLGIMFLQIITGNPPMGLTHHVQDAIDKGRLTEMLDPAVPDWPVAEAMSFARMSLQCAELRRKDRPDLGKVVLPELDRLRELAEDSMQPMFGGLCSFGNNSASSLGSKRVRENISSSGKSSGESTASSGSMNGYLTRSRASLSNRSLAGQAGELEGL